MTGCNLHFKLQLLFSVFLFLFNATLNKLGTAFVGVLLPRRSSRPCLNESIRAIDCNHVPFLCKIAGEAAQAAMKNPTTPLLLHVTRREGAE